MHAMRFSRHIMSRLTLYEGRFKAEVHDQFFSSFFSSEMKFETFSDVVY